MSWIELHEGSWDGGAVPFCWEFKSFKIIHYFAVPRGTQIPVPEPEIDHGRDQLIEARLVKTSGWSSGRPGMSFWDRPHGDVPRISGLAGHF